MNRLSRLASLLALLGLAACATPSAPPPAPVAPPAPLPQAPQPSTAARQPSFTQTGLASFYGFTQDGNKTADGERFDLHDFTAAHRTLAFGTIVRVTNMENGRSVKVTINDRGPHVRDRIIDLSYAAGRALGMKKNGVVKVRLEVFPQDQAQSASRD